MQIEVISISTNTVPTAKGSYQVTEVAYKDMKDGKVNGKKIMSFTNKEVYKVMTNAKVGDKYDIGLEKDDKGYWQWKSATLSTGGTSAATSSGNASPRSTYETPEERATRQDYIIRQSCLTNAIHTLKLEKAAPDVADVLKLADEYVKFVYNKQPESMFNDIPSDIPE